MYLTTNYNNIL